MRQMLDEQNVPEDGRWLILSPYDRHLLMQSSIAQAYFTGDQSSTIRTGKIGMLDRFSVYVSNLLPRGEAGKALVAGLSATSTGGAVASAKARRTMIAGTKHAMSFAMTVNKTEPLRNQTDFGDIVRGALESAYLGYYAFSPHNGQGHMSRGLRAVLAEPQPETQHEACRRAPGS